MAGAEIAGAQSRGLISTMKHFALNAQETDRVALDARIDRAAMREADLFAFEIAIEKGRPGSVMCAYNRSMATIPARTTGCSIEVLKARLALSRIRDVGLGRASTRPSGRARRPRPGIGRATRHQNFFGGRSPRRRGRRSAAGASRRHGRGES